MSNSLRPCGLWTARHLCQGGGFSRQEYWSISANTGCHTLLLLLSHFSSVRLCATPSLGFSRQEHWSGLPFPSPMHKVKSESEVAQLCPTLRDPMDCSLLDSSVHGIFQARVLEWGAIAFSSHTLLELYISCCPGCQLP